MFGRGRRPRTGSIYSFLLTWLILSFFFPMYELYGILIAFGFALLAAFLFCRATARHSSKAKSDISHETRKTVDTAVRKIGEQNSVIKPEKKSYGPEVDPVLEEGNKALSEMGRLYMSIRDPEI